MKERLNVEFRVDLDAIIDEPRTTDTPLEELREKKRTPAQAPRKYRRDQSNGH